MIVRRFMNWLRLTVATVLGGFRPHAAEQHTREPVLIGAAVQQSASKRAPVGLPLSSWLDNGRRLRPRLRLMPTPRDPGSTITRPLRLKNQPATPPTTPSTTPPAAGLPTPHISLTPIAADPKDAPPPLVPVFHAVEEQGDDLTNLERLDTETRRLMLLRHLVRRRVFNEGFASNDIPKQYQRSLGLEPPSTDD